MLESLLSKSEYDDMIKLWAREQPSKTILSDFYSFQSFTDKQKYFFYRFPLKLWTEKRFKRTKIKNYRLATLKLESEVFKKIKFGVLKLYPCDVWLKRYKDLEVDYAKKKLDDLITKIK